MGPPLIRLGVGVSGKRLGDVEYVTYAFRPVNTIRIFLTCAGAKAWIAEYNHAVSVNILWG